MFAHIVSLQNIVVVGSHENNDNILSFHFQKNKLDPTIINRCYKFFNNSLN